MRWMRHYGSDHGECALWKMKVEVTQFVASHATQKRWQVEVRSRYPMTSARSWFDDALGRTPLALPRPPAN